MDGTGFLSVSGAQVQKELFEAAAASRFGLQYLSHKTQTESQRRIGRSTQRSNTLRHNILGRPTERSDTKGTEQVFRGSPMYGDLLREVATARRRERERVSVFVAVEHPLVMGEVCEPKNYSQVVAGFYLWLLLFLRFKVVWSLTTVTIGNGRSQQPFLSLILCAYQWSCRCCPRCRRNRQLAEPV